MAVLWQGMIKGVQLAAFDPRIPRPKVRVAIAFDDHNQSRKLALSICGRS